MRMATLHAVEHDGTNEDPWSDLVLSIVWRTSASLRNRQHRRHGRTRCFAGGPPGAEGRWHDEECARAGCLDTFHDLLVGVVRQLRAAETPSHSPAWLSAVARNELADQQRAARIRSGLPSRPERSEGPAGAVEDALTLSATTPHQQQWLLALFRMMRVYACRTDRTSARWPVESWTGEMSIRLGGVAVTPTDVAADIRRVLDVATCTASASWVRRSILLPMLAVRDEDLDLGGILSRHSVEEQTMVVLVASHFRVRRQAGVPAARAWREATALLGGAVRRPQRWAVELLEAYEVS